MTKLNLLDDHRKAWKSLLGKRKYFRGTVKRFGHKHRQGAKIKRGATLLLTNVHLKYSNKVIDHAWIEYNPKLAVLGEYIKPGSLIEFEARVDSYDKGGKNIYGKGTGVYQDLELVNVKHVKVLTSRTIAYGDLIDNDLVSYAIRTRTNIKHGTYLGKDPKGYLGSIYVGQTFANKLARYLSWKWKV